MSDCSDIWIDGDTLFAGIAALAAGRAFDKESINAGKVARMLQMRATDSVESGPHWQIARNLSSVSTPSL